MKKNININLQGLIFHIEDDGYEVLSRYLQEVKAHFASYQGHEEIVADIEGRIAELFAARLSVSKQVITLTDVEEMTAKMGRVSDFQSADEDDEPAYAEPTAAGQSAGFGRAASGSTPPFTEADGQPRRLYRDLAHRKIAGVCAGLAQYFMVNPLVVRLGFVVAVLFKLLLNSLSLRHIYLGNNLEIGGLAIVAYLILWIALPKRDDAPAPIDTLDFGGALRGRKLFRDTDAGKVGGVAAGLAAYFRTDVVLVRVLFLLSLFLGGSGFFIYLILWVVVPEARTMSEKMQMRGDAVTLSGIDNNLRAEAFDTESATAPDSRSIGTFLEGAARGAQPAVSFLGTAIRWGIAALLIFMGGWWLFIVLGMGAVGLGWLPADAVMHNDRNLQFDGEPFSAFLRDVQPWSILAAMVALGIPALALMLLGVRLLVRRSLLGRTGGVLLLGVWLVGLMMTVAAGVREMQEFRSNGTYSTTRQLAAVPGPGIVLDSRNMEDFLDDVSFNFAPTDSNAAPFVEEVYRARGRTADAARLTAQRSVRFGITQQDSTITFDQGLALQNNARLRGQSLRLTLHLPLNKVYRLTPLFMEQLDGSDFTSGQRPTDDQPHRARFTREGKFTCLDCPASDDDSDEEDVVDVDVAGAKTQVRVNTNGDEPTVSIHTSSPSFNTNPAHYGTSRKAIDSGSEFSEIEASGLFRVLVRQGDGFKAEAAGRADDLDDVRLEVRSNRLIIRSRRNNGLFSAFGSNHNPILVQVTLPRLRRLELSAACQADVSGFRDEDLRFDASSAASARLDVNVPHLEVDLSSAAHAELSGTATELSVDGSSASSLDALNLRATKASLDLSSGSEANVHATDELKVDLSSGSQVRYAGRPGRIEKELHSGSSLEEVKE